MRRGEIWVANFNPPRGREVGKIRPALIFQANWLIQQGPDTIIALPLSTQLDKEREPLRVFIRARDRLLKDSHVVLEKLRALDVTRFVDGPLTTLTQAEMLTVERTLLAVLGISPRDQAP